MPIGPVRDRDLGLGAGGSGGVEVGVEVGVEGLDDLFVAGANFGAAHRDEGAFGDDGYVVVGSAVKEGCKG